MDSLQNPLATLLEGFSRKRPCEDGYDLEETEGSSSLQVASCLWRPVCVWAVWLSTDDLF